jgi:4-hydroxy-4-methyl-2-oxoglutarate aldolase
MFVHCRSLARTLQGCVKVQFGGAGRCLSVSSSVESLLHQLRQLDTPSLCDADKLLLLKTLDGKVQDPYEGIEVMDSSIRPMNHLPGDGKNSQIVMAGIARTVQFTERDDFLPVLRGIQEAEKDEVLIVNTLYSSRAVAGELFCAEAQRKQLVGIIIDGAVRDMVHLSKYPLVRVYATGSSPYSGMTRSVGKMQPGGKILVKCGGVKVSPGDVIVGDVDGVLVGSVRSFQRLVPIASEIQRTESEILKGITSGSKSLVSMSNFDDHMKNLQEGRESVLQFQA